MIAKVLRRWLKRLGTETIYITPGSPWENGYCASFNGKLRMNDSTEKSFTPSKKLRWSSNAGAVTTTPSGRTVRWDTVRQPLKRRHPRSF